MEIVEICIKTEGLKPFRFYFYRVEMVFLPLALEVYKEVSAK